MAASVLRAPRCTPGSAMRKPQTASPSRLTLSNAKRGTTLITASSSAPGCGACRRRIHCASSSVGSPRTSYHVVAPVCTGSTVCQQGATCVNLCRLAGRKSLEHGKGRERERCMTLTTFPQVACRAGSTALRSRGHCGCERATGVRRRKAAARRVQRAVCHSSPVVRRAQGRPCSASIGTPRHSPPMVPPFVAEPLGRAAARTPLAAGPLTHPASDLRLDATRLH